MKDGRRSHTFHHLAVSGDPEGLSLQISARRQIITGPEDASVSTVRTTSAKRFPRASRKVAVRRSGAEVPVGLVRRDDLSALAAQGYDLYGTLHLPIL